MHRALLSALAACLVATGVTTATRAQGAFDMGALTNTLSQDAARRQAQKRAHGGSAPNAMSLEARKKRARGTCARARQAAEAGDRHAQLPRLLSVCTQAGY